MFGMYKKMANEFVGVLTGKGLNWGGSLIRPEATGYGNTYFAQNMLNANGKDMKGQTVLVSGSGNVAQYTVEKVNDLGGKVVTLSDSSGFILDEEGVSAEKLAFVMDLKTIKRGRIKEYADKYKSATYTQVDPKADSNPLWDVKAGVALPGATQNEINAKDAANLVKNGCVCVSEGSNMPTTPEAIAVLLDAGVLYGPGKAANAGGVAVSGLEMSQNSERLSWTREEVDNRLKGIMKAIHDNSINAAKAYAKTDKDVNYMNGANIAGFLKVATAMLDQGIV
jgi:glutamate dehydrogenase (NADP+)